MADTKFTPGPWYAGNLRINGYRPIFDGCDIGAQDGSNVALAYHEARDRTEAETRANASLIAAAPDLYQALKAHLDEHDRIFAARPNGESDQQAYYQTHPGRAIAYEMARAALAKAEGNHG